MRFMHLRFTAFLAATIAFAADTPAATTNPPASAGGKITKANYQLASRWLGSKVGKTIFDVAVTPHWLEDGDRFWYSFENTKGRRFLLVDPVKKTKTPVFDPIKLASLLTNATGLPYDSSHLPMRTLKFVNHDAAIQFDVTVPKQAVIPGEKVKPETTTSTNTPDESDEPQQRRAAGGPAGPANSMTKVLTFEFDLATSKLTLLDENPAAKPRWANVSPDDKAILFARNRNLWMMDAENYAKAKKKATDTNIKETQITTDGIEDFSYARRAGQAQDLQLQEGEQQQEQTDVNDKNARVPAIQIAWSQDSKKFTVIRNDERKVEKLWVINALAAPRPKLETYPYGMPGEANQPLPHMEVFDLATKARLAVKADLWQDQTLAIAAATPRGDAREKEKMETRWAAPGSAKFFISRMSRDLHKLDICSVDTENGEVKPVISERMNVYIDVAANSTSGVAGGFPLKVINNGTEIIWWSERDGWGHYYLYGVDGTLKNQITKGEWVAENITGVDEKSRTIYLMANGREEGEDPYYMHEYSAKLDGGGMKMLSPGNFNHTISMSDSGRFFLDTASRVNTVPEATLFDAAGAKVMDLEKVDMSLAMQAGFKFPEPFQVKADDGMTDLYGVMYKPFDFDATKQYPIIAFVYPGPQTESVTKQFSPRNANVALANLGFIVIEVGNRGGNPQRSKWYHTFGYTNLRDYGLADKKAAIEQLAARFPFIDINRVGITGHSGGGFMSTAAMLVYPDFFKVAVSESGNHENNIYNRWWSEKHDGVREITDKDGKVHFEYDIDKNSELAKNLKGHLMLATGDIDNNVHPANTIRLMDALIKANKRFDFVLLPGQRHGYAAMSEYFQWLRADYFCKYLLGDFDQSVDMWELNRDKPQDNKAPGQQRQVISSQQTTTVRTTANQ